MVYLLWHAIGVPGIICKPLQDMKHKEKYIQIIHKVDLVIISEAVCAGLRHLSVSQRYSNRMAQVIMTVARGNSWYAF